jgi:hypothetical protein
MELSRIDLADHVENDYSNARRVSVRKRKESNFADGGRCAFEEAAPRVRKLRRRIENPRRVAKRLLPNEQSKDTPRLQREGDRQIRQQSKRIMSCAICLKVPSFDICLLSFSS